MRKADLPGARNVTATNEPRLANRVMWRSKWALGDDARVGIDQPSHAMDCGKFEGFVEVERRQDTRQDPRQQRLAAARRAHE